MGRGTALVSSDTITTSATAQGAPTPQRQYYRATPSSDRTRPFQNGSKSGKHSLEHIIRPPLPYAFCLTPAYALFLPTEQVSSVLTLGPLCLWLLLLPWIQKSDQFLFFAQRISSLSACTATSYLYYRPFIAVECRLYCSLIPEECVL
jgi:hypothetical protein